MSCIFFLRLLQERRTNKKSSCNFCIEIYGKTAFCDYLRNSVACLYQITHVTIYVSRIVT